MELVTFFVPSGAVPTPASNDLVATGIPYSEVLDHPERFYNVRARSMREKPEFTGTSH
jgi:hypothetical protein